MTQFRAEAEQYRAALAARGFTPNGPTRMVAPSGVTGRAAQRLKQEAWFEALRGAAYSAVVLKSCGCCHEHVFTFSPEKVERVRAQAEFRHALGVATRAM